MREILFRGKDKDNNFVYGDLLSNTPDKRCFIQQTDYFLNPTKVDPDTVGQYIGRTDKNGEKIYDGDIVKSFQIYPNGKRYEVIREVKWINDRFFPFADDDLEYGNWWEELTKNCEVIGNVYDNPEMIKENKND